MAENSNAGRSPSFKVGEFVAVKCNVQPGPFSEERLVTIETVDGAISGFVRESELRQTGEGWQVRGRVLNISTEAVEVWIKGSFFTTNGLANVPPHLAIAA